MSRDLSIVLKKRGEVNYEAGDRIYHRVSFLSTVSTASRWISLRCDDRDAKKMRALIRKSAVKRRRYSSMLRICARIAPCTKCIA